MRPVVKRTTSSTPSRSVLLLVCVVVVLWFILGVVSLTHHQQQPQDEEDVVTKIPKRRTELVVLVEEEKGRRRRERDDDEHIDERSTTDHDGEPTINIPSLLPDSPVVSIQHDLLVCRKGAGIDHEPPRMSPTSFHEQIVAPRFGLNPEPPLPKESFVCLARCQDMEPELEHSLRYLGDSTKYSAYSLAKLCHGGHVPILVKIVDNKIWWTRCVEKLTATQHWTAVTRELLLLSRMVQLPNVVFAFDTGDFSTPRTHDPQNLNWMYTEPAVIRFVGDAAHSSLLWPTLPFITTTAYCDVAHYQDNHNNDKVDDGFDKWFRPCRSITDKRYVEWENKVNMLFWRGSPTGGTLDIGHRAFTPRTALNERFAGRPGYDVSFAQDAVPPYVDQAFIDSHVWKPRVGREEFGKYKMVMSLDGHTASWGLIEKLVQGSVMLIHESLRGYREHYYRVLVPWKHFLPVAADFSNLDKLRVWVLANDDRAKQMARDALDLVSDRLRPADTWCYLLRLLTSLGMAMGFDVNKDDALNGLTWEPMTGVYVSKTR